MLMHRSQTFILGPDVLHCPHVRILVLCDELRVLVSEAGEAGVVGTACVEGIEGIVAEGSSGVVSAGFVGVGE